MNEKFSFQRFWSYFKYDIVQMWRNNGKALLVLGGAGVILYVVHVLGSLVLPNHVWLAPSQGARTACFVFATLAFTLFQARTYGRLTEKRAGSSWLMLPASAAEKTVSMLLMTLVVLPLAFQLLYLGSDALICLLDPTAEEMLLFSNEAERQMLLGSRLAVPFVLFMVFASAAQMSYFLLCGLIFKKWKITGGITVLFVLMTLLVFFLAALAESGLVHVEMDVEDFQSVSGLRLMWACAGVAFLIWAGIAWGVYRRVKTLKH